MNRIKYLIIIAFFASCTPFLDVVPDNTQTLNDIFSTREEAYNALVKIYSYLPNDFNDVHHSHWLLGDEFVGRLDYEDGTHFRATRIMRGLQSVSVPRLSSWTTAGGGPGLYQGIRLCNVFIDHVHLITNMTDAAKNEWRAQAMFLKAYYHFLLIQKYGPIVIMDYIVPDDADPASLFVRRSKLEDCFDYVIKTIDEALPYLRELATGEYLGQIDRVGAAAIKARVLMYRASPFYNGNTEYFDAFYDHNREHFFPQQYDPEKWKAAADAAVYAIGLAHAAN
jgi:hypothetical protein